MKRREEPSGAKAACWIDGEASRFEESEEFGERRTQALEGSERRDVDSSRQT